MKYLKLLSVATAAASILQSCTIGIDKTWKITPTENILFYFEAAGPELGLDTARLLDKKRIGNIVFLKDVRYAAKFIEEHHSSLFADSRLKLVWDTLNAEKRLYLVDSTKALNLDIEGTSKTTTEDGKTALVFESSEKVTKQIGPYLVKHIGKDILLINDKGFVARPTDIARNSEGKIILKSNKKQ